MNPILVVVLFLSLENQITFIVAGRKNIIRKVSNGQPAESDQFNYAAALVDTLDQKPFCGATIIHTQFALTAAHCLHHRSPGIILVKVSSDLRFDNETKFETLAEKLVMHPYYIYSADDDEKNLSFDIGLVELEDSINKDAVNIVLTPSIGEVVNLKGGELYLAGFGKHSDDLPSNEQLSWIRAKIVPDNHCDDNYNHFYENGIFCASSVPRVHDATKVQKPCCSDSGSGLVWTRGYDKILIGVLVRATKCDYNDENEEKSFYLRVEFSLDWICRIIRDYELSQLEYEDK